MIQLIYLFLSITHKMIFMYVMHEIFSNFLGIGQFIPKLCAPNNKKEKKACLFVPNSGFGWMLPTKLSLGTVLISGRNAFLIGHQNIAFNFRNNADYSSSTFLLLLIQHQTTKKHSNEKLFHYQTLLLHSCHICTQLFASK